MVKDGSDGNNDDMIRRRKVLLLLLVVIMAMLTTVMIMLVISWMVILSIDRLRIKYTKTKYVILPKHCLTIDNLRFKIFIKCQNYALHKENHIITKSLHLRLYQYSIAN